MTYKSIIAVSITVFLWASAFVGIRAGLMGYSPEGMALLRFLIASICMTIIYFNTSGRTQVTTPDAIKLMGVGALGIGLYNITLNHAEMAVSSGMASFIISQSPILTAAFAVLFLGERLNPMRVAGFLVSMLGVAIIALSHHTSATFTTGLLYLLAATVTGACYSILQKPFLKKYQVIEVTTYVIWGATILLSIFISELQHDLIHASPHATWMVIYLGVFPAAMAYIAWGYALSEMSIARAVSFLYFMPFIATLLGWAWLGEVPVLLTVMGGITAIAGVWLVNRSYIKAATNLK